MPYIGNSPKNNVRGRFYYTASASQTLFSGADSNGKTLAYQDGGYVDVYLNGVLLQDTIDYTATTKTSVTLTSGATAGDLVEIIAYGIFSVADTVSALSGGTFKNNIDVVGTVTSDGLAVDGDVTFYEDTGTTAKFFWDASAERLELGDSVSPRGGSSSRMVLAETTAAAINWLEIQSSTTGRTGVIFSDGGTGNYGLVDYDHTDDHLKILTASSEAMRIDSSGNLLVGKTAIGISSVGGELRADGQITGTKDGGAALALNRKTSDGDIAVFQKDGSSKGSIGNVGNNLFVNSEGAGGYGRLQTQGTDRYIWSANQFYPAQDNNLDLGYSTFRFDDVYATNGTIQTSDRNEKQQIASLTDAEITAAKAISKLFKTFKWNDKVAEKGDAARTHAGVIAQDVQQAMTDAGLDAGNYAFFISSTWWETQTEVPAVEAVDEVVDEDGNVITEAVEAKEAYTRTDTYDTLEEAPAGATERTRLGIRYPELLAFIGAATEQRLTSIEARLAALETA